MKVTHSKTPRGFARIEFEDEAGLRFSLQMSSAALVTALWFSCGADSMHLSQDEVRALLPFLRHFADTGEVGMPAPSDAEAIDAAR